MLSSLSSFSTAYEILESKASKQIKDIINCKNIYFTNSGTSALWAILTILKKHKKRNEVIIPSYICGAVLKAITEAGLKAKPVDVNLFNYNLDTSALEEEINDNILAIVAPHLFGFPCDIRRIVALAKKNNSFVIEDAAQSLGAKIEEDSIGIFGDFAFFSFGKGKNISIVSGGALCINNYAYKYEFDKLFDQLAKPKIISELKSLLLISLYAFAIKPTAYFLLNRIISNKKRKPTYQYKLARLNRVQLRLLNILIEEFDTITSQRRRNANILSDIISKTSLFEQAQFSKDDFAVYPSFPVLANSENLREDVCKRLNKKGIGASRFYRNILSQDGEVNLPGKVKRFVNAELLERQLFILPTIPFLNKSDIQEIENIFLNSNLDNYARKTKPI